MVFLLILRLISKDRNIRIWDYKSSRIWGFKFPNKRNIPKLRFSDFTDEWEIKKLEEVAEKVSNKNGDNKIVTVFSNSAVQGIVLQSDYFDKSIANKENLGGYYIVEPFDFVYNPRLSATADVGAMNVNKTNLTGLVSPLYTVFRIRENNINIPFLEYLFKSKVWHHYLRSIANYGARDDRMNVKNEDFYNLPLAIPNVFEQNKVSTFLSLIETRIQTQKKIITKVKSQMQILEDSLLTGKIRLKDDEGNLFNNWTQEKLSDIGKTYNGLSGKTKEDFGSGKKYIQYKQIFDSSKIKIANCAFVSVSENESQNSVQFGDIFFTVSSETPEEIGMSSVLLEDVENVFLNSFCFGFRTHSFEKIIPEFSQFFFRSKVFRNEVVKLAQGSTRYNISKIEFLKLNIIIPSKYEQIKIATFLSAIDKKINLEKDLLAKYEFQKKYLLANLFI